jgi:hypothetical protein
MTKPIASLSLDLDDKWSYMKTHGEPGWESHPSYLDILVPRVLSFLKRRDLTITFFVVGQDAALDRNRDRLRSIAEAGHEIGNHSFHHEQWLHLYSEQQIAAELAATEEHIERATGQRTIGFRGPGFSLSRATLKSLAQRGYLYDASAFPTFLGPLARAYYFRTAKLSPNERYQRQRLYGELREGLRPVRPYRWKLAPGTILEIPVTTMPIFRVPIHVSYILYLCLFSRQIALHYFRTALMLCRSTGTPLSLLLHPLDFVSSDDTQDLGFFPAMGLPTEKKLEVVSEVLNMMSSYFTIVTLREHARQIVHSDLPIVEPDPQAQASRSVDCVEDNREVYN